MPVLAHHDSITGPLTAADLEAARRDNPGSIWHSPHRLLPHGCDQSGRYATRQWGQFPDTVPTDFGAPEGGTFRDPAPAAESMFRHRRNRATVSRVLLLAVVAYGAHLLWPLVAA